jgi:hypothetical protein
MTAAGLSPAGALADAGVSINIARAGSKLENGWVITRKFISLILLACASSTSSAIAADQKAITTNWTAFFNPKTPVAQRVSLLQDGSEFASVIKAQAGSSLASLASAQVTKVTVITSSQAAVTYNILEAGSPVLKAQAGTAVFQDGTWKVGVASFCGLLSLENGGKTSGLPAACASS